MLNDFQIASDKIERFIKIDCNRNSNPTLLTNLKSLYDTYAANPAQNKDDMKVFYNAN